MNIDRDTLELIRLMDMSEKGTAQLRHYDRVEDLTGTLLGELRRNASFEFRFRFTYNETGEVLDVTHELPHDVSVTHHLFLGVPNEVWGQRWSHDPDYPSRLECIASAERIAGVDIAEIAGRALEIVRSRYATSPEHIAIAAALGHDELAVIEDARDFASAVSAEDDALLSAAIRLVDAGTLYDALDRLGGLIATLENGAGPRP